MTKVAEKYKPKKIMAAVVEPKTGKVLAMGAASEFRPEYQKRHQLLQRLSVVRV